MLHVFTMQAGLRLRSNAYSRLFFTHGSSTPSPKSSAGGFCWKQGMRLCVRQVNKFYTHTAQHFCGELCFAVIISFHYTETTNRFQGACAEMHFNGPNSGFLIRTLFTLNYQSRQLPEKINVLKVMQTFTFLQNSQQCLCSFLEHATSSNP